jgi:hypothetical protein
VPRQAAAWTTIIMMALIAVVAVPSVDRSGASAPRLIVAQATPGVATDIGDPRGTSPHVPYVTWANVNRWDIQIVAAARRFAVPPEYLKAIIAKESGGYWDDPKTDAIIQNPDSGATGLVQAMPDAGNEQLAQTLGLSHAYTDPAENVMLGAAILAEKHQVALSMGYTGESAWSVATGGYFGDWPATMGDTDATGTSGTQYVSDIAGMVNELRSAVPGAAVMPTPLPAATPSD